MGDHARPFEKADRSNALGAVDDLVREDEIARLDFFTEGAYGRKGDDGSDAEGFESGDVGSAWDGGGGDGVSWAVSGEKGDVRASGQGGDRDG